MSGLHQTWMEDAAPLSDLIQKMKSGDREAAAELWRPCFELMVRFARRQMSLHVRTVASEEDVALLAFYSLWQGVTGQRFEHLKTRKDLWSVLWNLTRFRVVDHHRQFSMGRYDLVGLPKQLDGQAVWDPLLAGQIAEDLRECLPVSLRPVAELLLAGFSNDEIARELGLTPLLVRRRAKIIEISWRRFLLRPSGP